MKIKAIAASLPAPSKLMVSIGVVLLSMVVFSFVAFGVADVFYGISPLQLPEFLNDLANDQAVQANKVLQIISSVGFFILPALLLASLFNARRQDFLRLNKPIDIYTGMLAVATILVAIPLINYLGELNSRLLLPKFLGGLDQWIRNYEHKADLLTDAFLKMDAPADLAVNIFMIGLLPAVGEELLFRGVIQRILSDWTKSRHWAIWITALAFSAVHLQFFGFVPRLLLGALLGYLFAWSGSLWLPIIVHFVNNAAAVVLTYLFSSGLLPFNPSNMGGDDGILLPVAVSAALAAVLIFMIDQRERRNRWLSRTVVPVQGEIIDYESILIDYFDKHEEKPVDNGKLHTPVFAETPSRVTAAAPVFSRTETEVMSPPVVKKTEVIVPADLSLAPAQAVPITMELENFEITDFSDQAQQEMITRMNLPYKLGSAAYISFLSQYGFIKRDNGSVARPTGLGLLMIGKSPQLHFPQARIKFTLHRGKDEPAIKDFEGPLVLMPGKIEEYLDFIVSSSINRDQFHRVVLSEIPKKVLREVIINAIVHRDYSIEGARIMVDAYDNRVEVSSPGAPRSPIKKFYDCTVPSISRNQKISYIFNQMHLVEERGLGMKELKTLKEDGNPPDFKLDNDIFTTIIYRSKKSVNAKPEETPNLTEEAVKEYIKQKHRISAGDYSTRFNVTTKTAQRHLNKLIEDGVIDKEGDRKGTKYFLK